MSPLDAAAAPPLPVSPGANRPPSAPRGHFQGRNWQRAKRGLTVVFFLLIAGLLAKQARSIDWPAVGNALGSYGWPTLLAAAGLAAFSHCLVACYELIGRHLTGHRLTRSRTAAIGAASYAFNLNLGSLVGGLALRSRLYTRAGLPLARAGQIIALSIVTNWLGYLVLAGALFVWQPLPLPQGWDIESGALRWLGVAMLAVAAVYLAACALAPRRRWQWRGHSVTTPSAQLAWLQLGLSTLNWLTMATILWVLVQWQAGLPSVALVLLVAAVAGVITHVPGNLGVMEAVFIALLSHRIPAEQLLAALIVYRAVYYLLPLLGGGVLLWRLERGRRKRSSAAPSAAGRN